MAVENNIPELTEEDKIEETEVEHSPGGTSDLAVEGRR
jgi:hypothetical protein